MEYNFKQIEKDWQKYWADNQTFKAEQPSDKPKYYVLDMFPYPSGAGLHVGHPLGYIASDIFARYKRHKGFNVLHPQGYDSFGLPAEQYAIQTGQHPAETTKANIATYRKQLDQIGFSFDWSREFRTSDSSYYKWTLWIFTKLYDSWYNKSSDKAESISILVSEFEKAGNASVKAVCDDDIEEFTATDWSAFSSVEKQQVLLKYRLTYLSDTEVNWCPGLGTVLANDEIINGLSERGGHEVVRKKMKQWSMRISAYADRLLSGLDTIDWPAPLKDSQTNWIGKSKGALVSFNTEDNKHKIEVFTTRPDTIYGVSFMVLAPEHELVNQITTAEQKQAIEDYVFETSKRSERDRMADVKNVSGCFTGAYATNPFTGKLIPIWIADYVLAGYGTGAIMAVPSGDQRDWDFATKFDIEIPNILADKDGNAIDISEAAYDGKDTFMQNSDTLNGLNYKKASKLVLKEIYDKKIGEAKVNFRLRDAVFSRQRYWGEPFPVYYKDGMPQMIDVKHLPIELPEVDKYLPTEDGAPPLGNAENWAWDTVNNKTVSNSLIDGETVFALELNTMPGWAGSSWYFNRYMDSDNNGEFVSKEASDYWQDIDLYIGGSEHATGHLLYARFWQKFLFDLDLVPKDEFAKKLINQGMILGTSAFVYRIEGTKKYVSKGLKKDYKTAAIHVDVNIVNSSSELDTEAFKNWRADYKDAEFVLEDGKYIVGHEVEKMSKSKYNVVNPDIICQQYGADALRLFEMFLGPLEQAKPWQTSGISGVYSFLKKLWKLYIVDGEFSVSDEAASKDEEKILHKTIKKVEEDISNFSFNTSVSTFMIAVNELTALKCNKRAILEPLSVLLSPYAPHIAEELWAKMGNKDSIAFTEFPVLDESKLVEDSKVYPISFNGKMRFTMELSLSLSKDEIEKEVMAHEKTIAQLDGRTPKKVIIVPGKIVNIVG